MRGNRSRDTKPEVALRHALFARGLRYRVAARPVKTIRRTADIVFPGAHVAVFVDGCFWHGCPEHYVPSKSNIGYWQLKIEANRARDRDTDKRLIEAGWMVIRVWEHEDVQAAVSLIESVVRAGCGPTSLEVSPRH